MAIKDKAKLEGELSARVNELRTIVDSVEARAEKRYTPEEKARSLSLREEIEHRSNELVVAGQDERSAKRILSVNDESGSDDPKKFRSIGESIEAAYCNLKGIAHEKRDMVLSDGASGGWKVPTEFAGTLRQFTPSEAVVRPRATIVPSSSSSPDADAEMIGFDQSGSKGVYGGVTVKWKGEVSTREESAEPALRMVKLSPKECSAYIDLSNKLLRNASEMSSFVEAQIRLALKSEEDMRFLRGDGVSKPLGIVGHNSSTEVTRTGGAGTATLSYTDIVNMFASVKFGGNLVWVANQTVLPKLMTMADAANQLIWQPNARDGLPGSILGLPVMITDRLPVLGTKADFCLMDFSYYGIKDGAPMSMMLEPYTQAVNQITRLYVFHNVDGQPLVKDKLLLEDGSSTVSPFVILK